jgi:hypothetical protein
MLKPVHVQITRLALNGRLSERALAAVVDANVGVDSIFNLIGHPECHFDDNAFDRSHAFMEMNRSPIRPALERGDPKTAWHAFGRLIHTAQDFYAHTNYVDLWLSCQPIGMEPAANEIDALDDSLVDNPSLRSGKMYFPLGALSFVPGLKKLVIPHMPRDSHAWMHLDSAERGPMFQYAFHAALKRTRYEFEQVERGLPSQLKHLFDDLG